MTRTGTLVVTFLHAFPVGFNKDVTNVIGRHRIPVGDLFQLGLIVLWIILACEENINWLIDSKDLQVLKLVILNPPPQWIKANSGFSF